MFSEHAHAKRQNQTIDVDCLLPVVQHHDTQRCTTQQHPPISAASLGTFPHLWDVGLPKRVVSMRAVQRGHSFLFFFRSVWEQLLRRCAWPTMRKRHDRSKVSGCGPETAGDMQPQSKFILDVAPRQRGHTRTIRTHFGCGHETAGGMQPPSTPTCGHESVGDA